MKEIYMSSSEIPNNCTDCKFRKNAGVEGMYVCPINKIDLNTCIECRETLCPIRPVETHDKEIGKEVRAETFMEIMELLRCGYDLPIDDIAREIQGLYGVEAFKGDKE